MKNPVTRRLPAWLLCTLVLMIAFVPVSLQFYRRVLRPHVLVRCYHEDQVQLTLSYAQQALAIHHEQCDAVLEMVRAARQGSGAMLQSAFETVQKVCQTVKAESIEQRGLYFANLLYREGHVSPWSRRELDMDNYYALMICGKSSGSLYLGRSRTLLSMLRNETPLAQEYLSLLEAVAQADRSYSASLYRMVCCSLADEAHMPDDLPDGPAMTCRDLMHQSSAFSLLESELDILGATYDQPLPTVAVPSAQPQPTPTPLPVRW